MENLEPEHIFWGVLGFSWVEFIWESYLSHRQRNIYKKHTSIPEELKEILDNDTFTKARLYALDKSNFGAVQGIFSQLLSTALMLVFAFKYLWDKSGKFFFKFSKKFKKNFIYHGLNFKIHCVLINFDVRSRLNRTSSREINFTKFVRVKYL